MRKKQQSDKTLVYGILVIGTIATMALVLALLSFTGGDFSNITGAFSEKTYSNASFVVIEEAPASILKSRYAGDREEFIYCMYGSSSESEFRIKELKETSYVSDDDSATFMPCKKSKDYLGTIHSHPDPQSKMYQASCSMSRQDIFTFGKHGDQLTAIICGTDEFGFYTPDELKLSLDYTTEGE